MSDNYGVITEQGLSVGQVGVQGLTEEDKKKVGRIPWTDEKPPKERLLTMKDFE